MQFAAKLLRKDLQKLAKWCAKWRIKLNPEKTEVIIFSRSSLARNSETHSKTVWRETQNLSSSEISRNYFRLQFHLQKHFEEILGCCNTRYHRIRLLANKIWGPSPPPYYKSMSNVSCQFSNMAPFRP